jgi:hypothetical protein
MPPPPPRPRSRDLLATVFIVAMLVPNLAALVLPFEHFPYSSAPMFAHYVADDVPLYRFRFVAEPAAGPPEREVFPNEVGLLNVEFYRHFFGSVYGSIDPRSPYGHHVGDSPAAFEARLGRLFRDLVALLPREGTDPLEDLAGIRLELVRWDAAEADLDLRIIGRYDVAAERFTHTWRSEP